MDVGTVNPSLVVSHAMAEAAGALVRDAIHQVLQGRPRCRLGVAGGSSPRPTLRWLADALAPEVQERLDLTVIDERHDPQWAPVPWRELPETSNARGVWEAWLQHTPTLPSWMPLDARGSLDEARAQVSAAFERTFGGLDVVLMGCGPDGHVASLFPGHAALDAVDSVLAVADSPKPPPERLTLSLSTLRAVHTSVLVASGPAKASALARAWNADPAAPLTRARPTAGAWHWVVDPAAATHLEPT